ncbi:MAG: hypothetical protein IT491_06630 [Gammaproteobacteria bacterium]|nr:hypothetical protein [Gammaproteobacteria bacterium]
MGSLHAGTVSYLTRLLTRSVGDQALVSVHHQVVFDEYSEPEPDVALLRWLRWLSLICCWT